jgi:hypothetical protein
VADEELSPAEAAANRVIASARQQTLDVALESRKLLNMALAGRAPLILQLYGGENGVRTELLVTNAFILYALGKLTDDGRMKEFYNSLADFLEQLRRGPLPSFVKAAPALYAKNFPPTGRPPKKKAGAPKSVNEKQRAPLLVLDAIIRLANEGFMPLHAPAVLVAKRLGIGPDALRHRRKSVGGPIPGLPACERNGAAFPQRRAPS